MKLLTLLKYKSRFENSHPKAVNFINKVILSGLPEGSILELSVTKPGEEKKTANLKITKEDLEILEEIKNMR